MSRIAGLERNQAPLSVRWMYGRLRSMFGKELTPFKVRARVPKLAWAEGKLGKQGAVMNGKKVGSASVFGLSSVSAERIALSGRQKL